MAIASKFINSLNENLYCFPSSVCWLVRQIHALLSAGSTLTEKQVLNFSFLLPLLIKINS